MKFDHLFSIVDEQPYPLLFATVSGAHLYGFPSPDSDYDFRGVHILPVEELITLDPPRETVEYSGFVDGFELDLVTHDVRKFITLLLKKNGYVLEQLYSPLIVHTSNEHRDLKRIATSCITKYHSHHYLGFKSTQWGLFLKTEPKEVKPLLYVFRVLLTGIHLMRTGRVEANLNTLNEEFQLHYIPELIERKIHGKEHAVLESADLSFYEQEIAKLTEELEDASKDSKLPERPSVEARGELNELLKKLRLGNS